MSSDCPIRNLGKGKKPWQADFRYIGGKREFFETKASAERAREEKLIEFRNHGVKALQLTPDEREEFIRAKDRLKLIGASLAEAIDFYERHRAIFTPKPIAEALEELKQSKIDTNKRERTVLAFSYTLEAFKRHIGETRLVSEISQKDCEDWLFRQGWAPYTVKTKLIDLQTFFRGAKAKGWTPHVPTDGIPKIELDDKPPGIFTVEQCSRLMNAAREVRPKFCGFIALALFCGIRPDEIEGIGPEHIKIDRGFVEVPAEASKTRERRIVDLSDNAKAWLRVGMEFPVKNARGNLNAVRIAAGFCGNRREMVDGKEKWIVVPGEEWPHDAMRHSFASYHLAMHGSADKTATQMGHRSTDMLFRHYRELVDPEHARMFWQIMPLN